VQPLYKKVKSHILDGIASGRWGEKDRLPSENELVSEFGISRMTAHRALHELNREGVVLRVPGLGTFVAPQRATSHPLEVRNIADEIRDRNHEHRCQVKILLEKPATPKLAGRLHIAVGDLVYESVIVHLENGTPIQLEQRHVTAARASGYLDADYTRLTPSEFLNGIAPLQESEHVVRALQPTRRQAKWLQIDAGEPCLVIDRRTWAGGRPMSVARLHHPGSRYQLTGRFRPKTTKELQT
jgi:GntR family histidine utilization transcriptional repressor